jgi:hypothetical protein
VIDELVGDNQMPGLIIPGEASRCGGADDPIDPGLFEGPQVGPVGNQMGREPVVAAVAWEKGDLLPSNGPNDQRRRRVAVWCSDVDFLGVLEELVETGPPDYSDHESPLSALLDLVSVFFEPLDFASSDLLLDFVSSDLELLDREVLDFDLLDLESVT